MEIPNATIFYQLTEQQLEDFAKKIIDEYNNIHSAETYTKKEVLEILKISETTLWRLENENKIKGSFVRGKKIYKKSDILKFIES